ncbi:MAG: SGNH/GDSL hydrolase family protein [Acidobacteriaceae bacterium]
MKLIYCLLLCVPLAAAQTAIPVPARNATSTQTTAVPNPTPAKIAHMENMLQDWPDLARYRAENATLPAPTPTENRVIFMGDSITDGWGHGSAFFPGRSYINRGISGQTTPQMLVRFQPDVIALQPKVVVILAGTNDIAGNTGPSTPQMIEDNFMSMTQLAQANHIRVVLASILPAASYPWRPGIDPVAEIRTLNTWMREYSVRSGAVFLDYYSAMATAGGGMKQGLSIDGVHPNAAGYAIMSPLAEQAIAQAIAH